MRKINFERKLASLVIGGVISLNSGYKSNADIVSTFDRPVEFYNPVICAEAKNARETIWEQALVNSLYEKKEGNFEHTQKKEVQKNQYSPQNNNTSVPEPATLLLMALGATALYRNRKVLIEKRILST